MNKIIVFFFLVCSSVIQAQELKCTVKVNSETLENANLTVFKTLEKSLYEFVNKTNWSNQNYKPNEKIECAMFINITSVNVDQFTATIQVQSSRPIYNSTYLSPVFNYNDKDFSFRYIEFENLAYNPNSFDSNLISVIAFYANIIIGLDRDTFSLLGGTDSFVAAQNIAVTAQPSNTKGWNPNEGGTQNRFFLVNDLLSNTFAPYREALYEYHYNALDKMADDTNGSKEKIKSAIAALSKLNAVRPNSFLTRIFFDAKSDEIVSVFSGGPQTDIATVVGQLSNMSPSNAAKWANIKF